MPRTDKGSLASRLRWAREQSGLSQGQVAKLLGLHRPSVSELEAGRRQVKAEELQRLSRLYDVDLDWLMTGESRLTDDPRIVVAARQLAKLSQKDLDIIVDLLKVMREQTDDRD